MITLGVGVSITRGEKLHSIATMVTPTLSHKRYHLENCGTTLLFHWGLTGPDHILGDQARILSWTAETPLSLISISIIIILDKNVE